MRIRAGFTLLEIVVVLLIVAVATAVTVPAFLAPREEDELTQAVRQVTLLFDLVRDSAARGGVPLTLSIDSASGSVWVIARQQEEGDVAPAANLASLRPQRGVRGVRGASGDSVESAPFELPGAVRMELSRARATFVFTPGGAAFADSIVLRSGTAARLVTIDPWSGRAVAH